MCKTKKYALMVSGIALVILSPVMVAWQIANDLQLSIEWLVGYGYWAGTVFLITGILAIVTGRVMQLGMMYALLIVAAITSVVGGGGLLILFGHRFSHLAEATKDSSDKFDLPGLDGQTKIDAKFAPVFAITIPIFLLGLASSALTMLIITITASTVCSCCSRYKENYPA